MSNTPLPEPCRRVLDALADVLLDLDHDDPYVTEAELKARGLTRADVRRCCPSATERPGHGGVLTWRREELAEWLEHRQEGQQ